MSLSVASHAARVVADDAGTAPEQESTIDHTPQRISGAITDEPDASSRTLVPPYLHEVRGDVRTTAVFPFYFDRKSPTRHARLITPYYFERGKDLNADVLAGLVWSLRGPERNTFVLPPLYTHRNGKDWGVGLAPAFSTGSFDGRFHLVIPPLLTWHDARAGSHRTIVGPYFDFTKPTGRFRGLFPLVWSRADENDRFTVVPPLYFRFADDDPLKKTTVVPPFFFQRTKDEVFYGLPPLFFQRAGAKGHVTTVPPLVFQYAKTEQQTRVVTPLAVYIDDAKDGRSMLTWLYQRKRGDRNYDGVLPFFFRSWDDRDKSYNLYFPPLFYHLTDPGSDLFTLLPFFGRYQRDGVSNTWITPLVGRYKSLERDEQNWWLAPTFEAGWDPKSWHFNLHPLVYLRRGQDRSHTAFAPFWYDFQNHYKGRRKIALFPLYWDFRDAPAKTHARAVFPLFWDFENQRKQTRSVVGFPLYWDFERRARESRTTLVFPLYTRVERGDVDRHVVLNTMVEKSGPKDKRTGYAVHFFPLTAWGKNEQSRWWSVFYGLAGYERRGEHRRITAFWIPFEY
jgi:hypothetical protein